MTRLLLFLSSLCRTEREKEQRNPREAANDKRAKRGRGSIKNRLREPEISAPERLQVIKWGKQNSYNKERPENQWNKGVGEREFRKTEFTQNTVELWRNGWKLKRKVVDAMQLPWFTVWTLTSNSTQKFLNFLVSFNYKFNLFKEFSQPSFFFSWGGG